MKIPRLSAALLGRAPRAGVSPAAAVAPHPDVDGIHAIGDGAAPADRYVGLIASGGVAIILVLLIIIAALRGPWIDEFWTLELSDTGKGLRALIRDGWLHDAHPPLFNLWATFLTALGVTSIHTGRIVSNLAAAGLMILAALHLSRRTPAQAVFNAAMLLLVLSVPQVVEAFADYRSYFWQIAAFSTLILVARHVVTTDLDLDLRKEPGLAIVAVLATTGSIALHYISASFGGLLAGFIAVFALARGKWRWGGLLLATAALSSLFIVGMALLQAPNWAVDFDHSWIDGDDVLALGVPLLLAVLAIGHNPVPLAALRWAHRRWTRPERAFCALMAGVLIVGVGALFTLNFFKPIIVGRYLFAVSLLICAMMAALAEKLAHDRRLFGLLAVVSIIAVLGSLAWLAPQSRWLGGARIVARIVAECPTTRVYAASGWTLGPAYDTSAARREDAVFERAHRLMAERYGYEVHFIGRRGVAETLPGKCPVLIWFEHTPYSELDLQSALAATDMTGLELAQLSAIVTRTGFVLRADRPY